MLKNILQFCIVLSALMLTVRFAAAIDFGSVMDEKVRKSDSMLEGDTQTASPQADVQNRLMNIPVPSQSGGSAYGFSQQGSMGSIPQPAVPETTDTQAVPPLAAGLQPAATTEPAESELRAAVQKYIADSSQMTGTYNFHDQAIGKPRKMVLVRISETIEKSSRGYMVNADFSDTETGELVGLNFRVYSFNNQLNVIGINVVSVNGEKRGTQDAQLGTFPLQNMQPGAFMPTPTQSP